MDEGALWEIVRISTGSSGQQGTLPDVLSSSLQSKAIPSDAVMERLERKATIADALHQDYDGEWRPVRANGLASDAVAVGLAALFLIDAIRASSRGRALKRLNAADVLIARRYQAASEIPPQMAECIRMTSIALIAGTPTK